MCGPEWSERFDLQMKSPYLTHPSSMAEASIAFDLEGSGENSDGTGETITMKYSQFLFQGTILKADFD